MMEPTASPITLPVSAIFQPRTGYLLMAKKSYAVHAISFSGTASLHVDRNTRCLGAKRSTVYRIRFETQENRAP